MTEMTEMTERAEGMPRFLCLCFLLVGVGGCQDERRASAPCADRECGSASKSNPRLMSYLDRLKGITDRQEVLFGQQRFLLTGVEPGNGQQWKVEFGDNLQRSDVNDVTGQHPAVLGLDVWDLAMKPFDWPVNPPTHAKAMKKHAQRGGVVTLSWHMAGCNSSQPNSLEMYEGMFETNGASNLAVGNENCLCQIANVPEWEKWFKKEQLTKLAAALKMYDLTEVPIILRPFHEFTGAWFWWGYKYWDCENRVPGAQVSGPAAFQKVFRMVVDTLRQEERLENLLIAYSPDKLAEGVGNSDRERYLSGYPGDAYIDILGIDLYFQDGDNAAFEAQLQRFRSYLRLLTELAREKHKIAALTETGNYRLYRENEPGKSVWYSEYLLKMIKDDPGIRLAYALTWENRTSKKDEFYVPYRGHPGVADFRRFFDDRTTLFLGDIAGLFDGPPAQPGPGPSAAPADLGALPTCEANDGLGEGAMFRCDPSKSPLCGKTDTTYTNLCLVRARTNPAANGLPYCQANQGQGVGEGFPCDTASDLRCAKTDSTYQKWCVVRARGA